MLLTSPVHRSPIRFGVKLKDLNPSKHYAYISMDGQKDVFYVEQPTKRLPVVESLERVDNPGDLKSSLFVASINCYLGYRGKSYVTHDGDTLPGNPLVTLSTTLKKDGHLLGVTLLEDA